MATLKYSRQRESIKNFLAGRTDHPTAETIYTCLRETNPRISLGTVYRNLALLTELGEVKKISTGNGPDHFDADTSRHHHFICRECFRVSDMKMESIDEIINAAAKDFDGQIEGYVTNFYGLCAHCSKKQLRSAR
jgi:Fur family peroxide stress response transcriptional regulator